MIRTTYVLALAGVVCTLVASGWLSRLDRTLPAPDGAVARGDPRVLSLVEAMTDLGIERLVAVAAAGVLDAPNGGRSRSSPRLTGSTSRRSPI